MMRQYELVERVRKYNPAADEELLNRAYVYAMRAHGAQKRASGDPYLTHPLQVAGILTDLRLDDATIVAAVLHDTIEDTGSTREEIDQTFGPEIGRLVDGLTKIKKLDLVSKRAEQAENSASFFSPSLTTCASFSSSWPTGCTICARCSTCRLRSARVLPKRRSTFTRRSPAAWACSACVTSSKTWRSAICVPTRMR